ncbi:5-methylcytosine-specific restriction endonuclease McrA [Oceanisphaera litoralis]|nr:5-methylcytosine-specific restriction endonuclease McrA [Oceanisphaera litoralis]
MPCSEKRARLLLSRGRAVVVSQVPFAIRLKDRVDGERQPLRVKFDPGSKTSGVAVVREAVDNRKVLTVLMLMELVHRGAQIKKALQQRAGHRRRRRSQNLRHRAPRFNNRTRSKGWLPPSLQHRVDTQLAWLGKICKLASITSVDMERVRFDMQLMDNPEISGIEYQQGTLQGYEIREYLLEKWGRECAYCGDKDIPLQVEHIVAKGLKGSNRVSNLTMACQACNQEKDRQSLEIFFATSKALARRLKANKLSGPARLERVLKQMKRPLHDAAAVNATRWALYRALCATGLPVSTGSGGQTKFNRCQLGIPKTHALDAVCVGEVDVVKDWQKPTLVIKAMGRGSYQRTTLNKYGFPRGYLMNAKKVHGFQTGDMVRATVPTGRKAGVHQGRVAIRATGNFNIQTANGPVQGISWKHCALIQRGNGYGYHQTPAVR